MTINRIFTTLIAAAAACIVALTTADAAAQTKAVNAYYVTPERDGVALRCNPAASFYAVAELESSHVLKVDGEAADGALTWLRVEYPPGTVAVALTANASRNGDTVTLTQPASLRAYCMERPSIEQSFISIFVAKRLPPGTTMTYVDTINDANGAVAGYLVEAPKGAKGYILASDATRSTEAAYREFMKLPVATEKPAETGNDDTPAEPVETPVTDPVDDAPTETDTDTGTETDPDATDDASDNGTDSAAETATEDDAAEEEPAVEVKPVETPEYVTTFESLEEAFTEVSKQPLESAEFDSLIQGYADLLESVPDDVNAQPVIAASESRVARLRLRADFQRALHFLDEIELAGGDANTPLSADGIPFTVVGKLATSAVYDGDRLPRLYRVMSIDARRGGEPGRTLAYIRPDDKLQLPLKLNAIVGIVSRTPVDRGQLVNVLDAEEVRVIEDED